MTAVRVLHADDEPDIREVVELSLGLDPDLVVRSCASGEETLGAVEEWAPAIILLDMMMPVMDGAATLAHLQANPRTAHIPVVFMTARAQSRELDLFRSLGAVGVIPKPFDPMALAASLRAHIKTPEARLGAMRHKFLRRFDSDLLKLAAYWSTADNRVAVRSSLAGMRNIAHGLAGAGGIFGFDDISDAAATLEEAVSFDGGGGDSMSKIGSALEHLMACAKTADGR